MVSKQSLNSASLSDEQRAALIIVTKLISQLPDKSLKSNNLENDGLHFLRRIVKRLNQEFISGS